MKIAALKKQVLQFQEKIESNRKSLSEADMAGFQKVISDMNAYIKETEERTNKLNAILRQQGLHDLSEEALDKLVDEPCKKVSDLVAEAELQLDMLLFHKLKAEAEVVTQSGTALPESVKHDLEEHAFSTAANLFNSLSLNMNASIQEAEQDGTAEQKAMLPMMQGIMKMLSGMKSYTEDARRQNSAKKGGQ